MRPYSIRRVLGALSLRTGTLQFRIFWAFSSLVVALILGFSLVFFGFLSETLRSRAFDAMFRLTGSLSSQIDTKLQSMNSLTLNMMFSSTIVDSVHTPELFEESPAKFRDRWRMNELMVLLSGVDDPLLQVNILGKGGTYYGYGYRNEWNRLAVDKVLGIPSVRKALALEGKRLLVAPHWDDWGVTNRVVVSLFRSFSAGWGLPVDTVLEVQLDYTKLITLVRGAVRSPNSQSDSELRTWIFDETGRVVYPDPFDPYFDKPVADAIWGDLNRRPDSTQTWSAGFATGGVGVFAKTHSDFSGWTVVIGESEAKLMEPVLNLGSTLLASSALVMVLALVLSWMVSRTITRPIKTIYESISKLDLETLNFHVPLTLKSNINELEELNSAFQEMHGKLKTSLEEIVAARSHEIHSRLLALQSQMNPHFLYNTMVNISVLAEEVGAEAIVKACRDLSQMLRYISKDTNLKVTIREELDHTRHYLDLMSTRYGDRFKYKIEVPESMMEIEIPRLVIQPLAENSLKYGIERDPPWELLIEGACKGRDWQVKVSDNGPGFAPDQIATRNAELDRIDPMQSASVLELDGMGLTNIAIRLKLLYGQGAVFLIGNHAPTGAQVTIGGTIAEDL